MKKTTSELRKDAKDAERLGFEYYRKLVFRETQVKRAFGALIELSKFEAPVGEIAIMTLKKMTEDLKEWKRHEGRFKK